MLLFSLFCASDRMFILIWFLSSSFLLTWSCVVCQSEFLKYKLLQKHSAKFNLTWYKAKMKRHAVLKGRWIKLMKIYHKICRTTVLISIYLGTNHSMLREFNLLLIISLSFFLYKTLQFLFKVLCHGK